MRTNTEDAADSGKRKSPESLRGFGCSAGRLHRDLRHQCPTPEISFWQLVFVNARIFFVGSDDVPAGAKIEATRAINEALEAGGSGLEIAEIVPLDQIARAHELVEHPVKPGHVIVVI